MWRGTAFVYFLIFYGHTSSQPVTDDGEKSRQARQLDFGECCPCPGASQAEQHDFGAQRSVGEASFARASDLDDCPCRPHHADSVGATSIFFPTAMRSDEPFVRPTEKEDLKPLLHPEVDLASSVLQTLREATDEEYRDALARDAARSITKTAEETIFGDATPEASTGNILTIIMNPKQTDNQEDVIRQESFIQESSCVHLPLESAKTNFGNMRSAPKSPSLLSEFFGVPRISKSTDHKNLLDMDSGVGASNIQEHVAYVDDDQGTDKGIKGLRTFTPLMKLGLNMKDKYPTMKTNVDSDYSVKKFPDFKSDTVQNKLKDLISNKSLLGGLRKVSPLPLIPKTRLSNSLSKVSGKNNVDLSLSPSNIQEKTTEKTAFFKTKSHLENILEKHRPVSLKNLLKLKDVELIPLKDIVNKATEGTKLKPNFELPAIFRKGEDMVLPHNDTSCEDEDKEIIETFPRNSKNVFFDAEVSPSQLIEQISENNRVSQGTKTKSEKNVEDAKDNISSIEILDTLPSPTIIQSVVNNKNTDLNNSQSDELIDNIDDCDIQTMRITDTNLPQVTKRSWDVEIQDTNNSELDSGIIEGVTTETTTEQQNRESNDVLNENDCENNNNDAKLDNGQSDELTDNVNDCDIQTLPDTDTKLPQVTERSWDVEIQDMNNSELDSGIIEGLTIENATEQQNRESNDVLNETNGVNNNNDAKLYNGRSDELTDNVDDCDIQTLPDTDINLPQVTERSWDIEIQDMNNSELDSGFMEGLTTENATEQQNRESNDVLNDNDADLMTDSSNNVNHVIGQQDSIQENDVDSVADKNIIMEESCSQEQQAGNNLNTLDSNSEMKLINPLSPDKTRSTIKENIKNKLENLKNPKTNSKDSNIFDRKPPSNNIENKESFMIQDANQDTDCQNEAFIQITTVKPNICNEDLENGNESPDKISMEDLQKISDSMLQEEEKKRESTISECSKPVEEVTEPNVPLGINSRETEILDSDKSATSQNDVIVDPQNSDNFSDKNEDDVKNVCRSELVIPKQSLAQETDSNAKASEVVINRIPKSNNIMDKPCLLNEVVQPNKNNWNLLRGQLPDIQDIFKLPPLPTLDEITLRLNSLFDKNARDVEELSSSEAHSTSHDTSNILSPTMETEASTNFLLRRPSLRLEDLNLDILQLKPQSSLASKIPKIDLHSYNAKVPLPKDLRLKPIRLQSALEDRGSLLGATLNIGRNNARPSDKDRKISLDNFRTLMNTHAQKILGTPLQDKNLLGLSDFSENIQHAKNTWRSMHRTLESNLKEVTRKPTKSKSYDLLVAISRNHEDVNDKLKALHIDFNDRIESVRNDLIDKSRSVTSESRNRKPNTKSFSSFSKQNKGKPLSLLSSQPKSITGTRESKNTLTRRRLEHERQSGVGSSQTVAKAKKFKMPVAASVPVPRTIEVPELKTTSLKLPGLAIQRASGVKTPKTKETSDGFLKQVNKSSHNTKTPLAKSINSFKDSKIKVTFSTTPRPTITPKLQSRTFTTPSSNLHNTNIGRNSGRFGTRVIYADHNGSPTEVRHSMISPPKLSHLSQHNVIDPTKISDSRETERSYDEQMALLKSVPILGWEENSEAVTQPGDNTALQSWPKVSESAFLSKVKEAVKARLSKVNLPITLKLSDVQSTLENEPLIENVILNANTDMTRSASENLDVIEGQPLKENVSYKCRLVCTKEK